MSAIRFCTTPKGYLPHYSYIFRNLEPLGTEMENVACSRLGMMLHLEIQKGKEAMKKSQFQNVLGSTTGCMKRIAIATKGCVQLTSNDTYFADSWFSSVKTMRIWQLQESIIAGRWRRATRFFLDTLDKLTKDWPGGSYLVLKSTPRFLGEIPLLAIGYKYSSRKVLGFIAT